MIAQQIYRAMRDRNLTTSMRGWSRAWAGMAQNWLCSNFNEPLPPQVAIKLHRKLTTLGQADLAEMLLDDLLDPNSEPSRARS